MYSNYNPCYNPNYNIQPNVPVRANNILDGHQTLGNYQQPANTYSQPSQPIQMIQGKQVESIDIVKAIEIPLDGTISYFPVADGSAIVTKQLQTDGTTKISVFKPSNDKIDEVKYITKDDLKEILEKNQNTDEYVTRDELKDMVKGLHLGDIEDDIKDIKKQLKKKGE